MKEMSAALNERNKENRQDNMHNLESNHNNNDGETRNQSPRHAVLLFGFGTLNAEGI